VVTARDRRAVRIGLALVGGMVLAVRVVPAAARTVLRLRADVVQLQGSAARTRGILAAVPSTADSLRQSLQSLLERAEWLVQGRTPLEAAANLDAAVRVVATRSGLRLVEFHALPDSTAGMLATVATSVSLEGDVRGLAAFLEAVATGESPVLNIPRLTVQAAEPAAPEGRAEVLRLEALVRGWFLSGGEPPGQRSGGAP
jgi:hypothetical protein